MPDEQKSDPTAAGLPLPTGPHSPKRSDRYSIFDGQLVELLVDGTDLSRVRFVGAEEDFIVQTSALTRCDDTPIIFDLINGTVEKNETSQPATDNRCQGDPAPGRSTGHENSKS